ncbi:MAG: hypothetical protein PHQ23_10600 [Candidatus Wallbacteria bacterium]|nr:hypothetical protein [Candidatus Wallbacteria bacterium]
MLTYRLMASKVNVESIVKGPFREIVRISKSKKCEVQTFLNRLEQDAPQLHKKIFRTFRLLSEKDVKDNKELFRHERDGIYAIKADYARIYCFFEGNELLLCASAVKKKKEKNSAEENAGIDRCIKMRAALNRR